MIETNPLHQPENPAKQLAGTVLPDGWHVVERIPNGFEAGGGRSGGFFSVSYIVEKDGVKAFMKVFDIGAASQAEDFVEQLQRVTTQYTHEKMILDLCESACLTRIVKALGHGTMALASESHGSFRIPLSYIIFELAKGDIRGVMAQVGVIEDAWKLEILHHVAVGIMQLHGQKVAHQDIKPSNVLLFEQKTDGAKIADLGRSSRVGFEASHDAIPVPGDGNYAAPEHLYGYSSGEWVDRREACDLYHLGSLACFLFTGVSTTYGILKRLEAPLRPHPFGPYGGLYADVLPHLSASFTEFLQEIGPSFPGWCRDTMLKLVRDACHPDVARRGDPSARASVGRPVGIDRFVSRFDRLSKEAMVHARAELKLVEAAAGGKQ